MTVLDRIRGFSDCFGKSLVVNETLWRYYRVGTGTPILWLTGGLRRAALGFGFMERLARHHTVIAPDYPPAQTIDEYMIAFDSILDTEGVSALVLGGQSYGGMLAQAYVVHRGNAVTQLILSSSGPADYGQVWLPVEYAFIALARILPERTVKSLLARGLLKFITLPEAERAEWVQAINAVLQDEISRADVISHFAVAADLIRKKTVTPEAFRKWTGRAIVLSAKNDPTQSEKDIPQYERLFGRAVKVIDMGNMGHTAALFDPDRYVELLDRGLAG